jgi:hypothetical protein
VSRRRTQAFAEEFLADTVPAALTKKVVERWLSTADDSGAASIIDSKLSVSGLVMTALSTVVMGVGMAIVSGVAVALTPVINAIGGLLGEPAHNTGGATGTRTANDRCVDTMNKKATSSQETATHDTERTN